MSEPKEVKPEMKPAPVLTIWQALPKITGEISPIVKGRKNAAQGYSFRGIDDVYAVLNLLLEKYGVSILPTIISSEHDAFDTKNGAKMFRHRIRVKYKLVAQDGSHDFAESEGEGMDTGDKATPKAFSTSFKTMAFQVFCIPTGEKVEPNVDSEDDSPEVAAPVKPTNSKTNGNGHKPPAPPLTVAPEEQLAAELCEVCEAGFSTAADKEAWHTRNKERVNAMAPAFRTAVREAFTKAPVRS